MPTRPRHYAVFILNPDGSGTVKQFDTWQEAMTAYADSSNAGKAVYLYPQPAKAVGIGNTPIAPPVPSTGVTFTAAQNTGQYEWPPTPPGPRPTTSGTVFSDEYARYGMWMEYCKLNPEHRECSIPGKPKFGTESLVCDGSDTLGTWKSTEGNEYPATRPRIMLADGLGGTFPSEEVWQPEEGAPFRKWHLPCEYPNGFREYKDFQATSVKELIFGTLSGPTVLSINRVALMSATRKLFEYSGNVASQIGTEHGVLPRDVAMEDRELEVNALRDYEIGQPVFNLDFQDAAMYVSVTFPLKPTDDEEPGEPLEPVTEPVSLVVTETGNTHNVGSRTAPVYRTGFQTPSPNGPMNTNYDYSKGTGTGEWSVTLSSLTDLEFTFTPTGDTPADARPPSGWAGVVARGENPDPTNPFGGEFEGVDTTGVPPAGTHQGPWAYTYTPADTLLESDDENDYFTNGTGGYYAEAKEEPPGCDAAGELSRGPTQDYMYETPCGSHQLGYYNLVLYADGDCGTYEANDYDITSVGDFTTCEGTIYSVDAEGVVTTRPEDDGCDASGTNLGVDPNDSCNDVFADGMCGTYTSSNGSCDGPDCDPQGTDLGVDSNDACQNIYADGNCGTYTSSNGSCPNCDGAGTNLGVSGDPCYDLYADGNCGTYTSSNGSCDGDGGGGGGGGCDSAGMMVSNGLTADLYITTPCGEVTAGTRTYDVYTDGNCGTTESTTNESWSSNGTELNSCSDGTQNCTYYADGNGSYTSSCSPIEPPPEECESDSLHVEGEDGWTYDGCNWTQAADWDELHPDAGEPYNGTELMPETPEGGGNENGPPHEPGTGVAYDAQINSNGDWDVILV